MIWAILPLVVFAPPQQPAAPKVEFEVASVKPSGPYQPGTRAGPLFGGPGTDEPGRVHGIRVPLRTLVLQSFKVDRNSIDAPGWLEDAVFDINATVPAGATREQVPLMLQHLLSERFGLLAHKEMRDMPAYVLTIAKGGIKFKENTDPDLKPMRPGEMGRSADGPPRDRDGFPILPPHLAGGAGHVTEGVNKQTTVGMPMSSLVLNIGIQLERPAARVIDKTGLTGKYDFHLEYQVTTPGQPQSREFGGPPIAEALEKQLGLHLEKAKVPGEMLIVDHIERTPTEN